MARADAIRALNAYYAGSISATIAHPIKKRPVKKTAVPKRKSEFDKLDRPTKRVLSHARVIASTMKPGERRYIPRQKINNGKVMIAKGSGDKFQVYSASSNKYRFNSRTNIYGINEWNGSTKSTKLTLNARYMNAGNVDKYMFKKWYGRLFSSKAGKQRYIAGKTGSMGG